jgi:hypothetical protein
MDEIQQNRETLQMHLQAQLERFTAITQRHSFFWI